MVKGAAQFIEDRITEWTDFQRARYGVQAGPQIDAALEELGVSDLRRITAFWTTLGQG